jgi:hypothetical protein
MARRHIIGSIEPVVLVVLSPIWGIGIPAKEGMPGVPLKVAAPL